MTIASLVVDIGGNIIRLQQDVEKTNATLDRMSGVVGRVGRTLAGAFTVTALAGFARQMLSSADAIQKMRGKARRLKAEKGLDLLIVDYLQLMQGRSDSESRQQEISDISRSLKALAKELNVPVVALSQLSRAVEARKPPIPMLADLRESGAIEQDADVVMFICREDVYDQNSERKGIADIIVSKHRNGPIGKKELFFQDRYAKFESLDLREA